MKDYHSHLSAIQWLVGPVKMDPFSLIASVRREPFAYRVQYPIDCRMYSRMGGRSGRLEAVHGDHGGLNGSPCTVTR
eukprot:COSAG02_NODE_4537_length_5239_cov_3.381712_1_plen_76_part_10